jgi:multiple sugar transport system ATP-binding protein
MTMGHRVAVLRDGDLQQCDTPSMLYHEPANLFVAGFIGSPAMNMLPVPASGPLRIGTAELGVDGDLGGERATVGFRPETVVVGDGGSINGRIRVVEDLGSEVFVHLVIEHDGEERRIVAKAAAPFAGSPDDNVRLGLRGAVHLFDTAEVRRKTVTL